MYAQFYVAATESTVVVSAIVLMVGKVLSVMSTIQNVLWLIVLDTAIAGKEYAYVSKDGQGNIVKQVRSRQEPFWLSFCLIYCILWRLFSAL